MQAAESGEMGSRGPRVGNEMGTESEELGSRKSRVGGGKQGTKSWDAGNQRSKSWEMGCREPKVGR